MSGTRRGVVLESKWVVPWSLFAVCSAVFFVALAGCDGPYCADEPTESSEAPIIENLVLEKQIPEDPWTLVLAVEFADPSGDLGSTGKARFYLDGTDTGVVADLLEIFRQTGLATNSKTGRVGLRLRFEETVPDGATVWLGTQLTDGAGNRSNCWATELEFAVESAR